LATAIILLYESSLQIIGYLAGLLLSIIVYHNPDFKNQFEQFQNFNPQRPMKSPRPTKYEDGGEAGDS